MMTKHRIPLSENGRRIGEGHHNCLYSDALVTEARDMREDHQLTVPEIARRLGVREAWVNKVVHYQRRADVPRDWKTVETDDGE